MHNFKDAEGYKMFPGKDYPGYDIKMYTSSSYSQCAQFCNNNHACKGFVFLRTDGRCFTKYKAESQGGNFRHFPNGDLFIRQGEVQGKNNTKRKE